MINLKLLENGYLRVAVVGSSSEKAAEFASAFDGLGFRSVTLFEDFESCESALSKGLVDWVFASYKDKVGSCILDSMERVYSNPRHAEVIFSMMVLNHEKNYLSSAFAAGLFTWHPDKGVAEYTRQSLWRLKRKARQVRGRAALIPYLFLRSYLKETTQWSALVLLGESILKHYPHEDLVKVQLAETLLCVGRKEEATRLLDTARSHDPALAQAFHRLQKSLPATSYPDSLAASYNLKTLVYLGSVTPDLPDRLELFKKFGFEEVHHVTHGEKVWEIIRKENPDLLIMNWSNEGLSSANLLQRIRLCGYWDIPIIVEAKEIERDATRLAKYYGVAHTIKENSDLRFLSITLAWTIAQSQRPTESQSLERKIKERLGTRDLSQAKQYFEKYLAVSNRDSAKEKLLQAQIQLAQGQYLDVRYLLMEARQEAAVDPVLIDILLAQSYFGLGDFSSALQILTRIKKLGPNVIEINCLIVRCHLRLGDIKKAKQVIKEAKACDADHPWVLRMGAKIALLSEDTQVLSKIKSAISIPMLLSDCMNLGLTYCLDNSQVGRGLKLLKICRDLASIYDEVLIDWLEYNIAVVYYRSDNLKLAARHLERESLKTQPNLAEKYGDLERKIRENSPGAPIFFAFAPNHHRYFDEPIEDGISQANNTLGEVEIREHHSLRGIFDLKKAS